jgi:hypothetical protein
MAGHVYLIGSPRFRWYKIGKSSNASIRVSELGILLPFRIEVVAVWKVANHHETERVLHEKHAANRINGEWFTFTKEEITTILEDMLWASTAVSSGFSNLEADHIPEGAAISVKYALNLTPEEREERKNANIAKRQGRPYCVTCHQRLPEALVSILKKPCA